MRRAKDTSVLNSDHQVVNLWPWTECGLFLPSTRYSCIFNILSILGSWWDFFFLAGNSTISEINGKALAFSALLSMCFSTTLGVGWSVKHYLKGSGKNEKRAYHLMIQLKKSVEGSRTRMTWKKNVESWGLIKQMEWEVWWEAMG